MMSSPDESPELIVFAPADEPGLEDLRKDCPRLLHVSKPSAGIAALTAMPPDHRPPAVCCCGPLAGLQPASLAHALRSLPGYATLPLILVGGPPPADCPRCATLARPIQAKALLALLATDPDHWTAQSETTQPAVLDLAQLQHCCRGDRQRMLRLVRVLHQDLVQELPLLEQHLATASLTELCRCGHRLKGAAGSIGASSLADNSRRLEAAARDADLTICQSALAELRNDAARLQQAITALATEAHSRDMISPNEAD